ncbi:MAG TPA: tRNA lysidine(34) synthetase TilS [Bdellovibrionota bacterium]|jgi:tRNA(Ile)-lysidine synthetase-like protein|nr:tRNA lysidine(34) synthetase TilS [Bdellovibrionota bacterium]
MSTIVESSVIQDKTLQLFLAFCREHQVFRAGERVLVAASGGLDSTVLVHLLSRAAKLLHIEIEVAHIDHAQRGLASRREGAWVEVLAARLGLRMHRHQLSVAEGASHAELRESRRTWLQELAADLGASKIATAHHADDNAETFLMRAISGSGLQGLRAMAPVKEAWAKPLLWSTKEELRDYAKRYGLAWIEDPSNQRTEYLRNKLRADVLGSLEATRTGALRSLSRTALRLEEEERELETWIEEQLATQSHETSAMSLGWLETWPKGLQRRIFRIWLQKLGIMAQPRLVEDLLLGKEIIHSRGVFLKRSAMWVFQPETAFGHAWTAGMPVPIGNRISLGDSMAWSFCVSAPEPLKSFKHIMYLVLKDPRNVVAGSLVLGWRRLPRELALVTAETAKSDAVFSVLEAAKIPAPYRAFWPVLVDASRHECALAVVGLKVIGEYEWNGEGPALVIQAFFEEGLGSSEGT